jgi:Domain of unknown function (DUF4412)
MKRLFALGLFTLLSINPLFTAPAEEKIDNPLANAPTQYSADLVVSRKVGTPVTLRVYSDGNKRRTEQAQGPNGGTIVILRGDLGKRYMLNPGTKTYAELSLDPRMLESTAEWSKRLGIVHEKVGTEDLNGETCDKYHFSLEQKSQDPQNRPLLPRPQGEISGFIWVSQSTHMLMKSENSVTTAEWKNVKIGSPDSSLFEVPADFKKQETPNGFGAQKPESEKSPGEKSGEQKSTEQKPNEENSNGQKSDGNKSNGDNNKQQ